MIRRLMVLTLTTVLAIGSPIALMPASAQAPSVGSLLSIPVVGTVTAPFAGTFAGTAAITGRSNIEIDRNFYYTDKAYYTNEVEMYDLFDWGGFIGFYNKHIHADLGVTGMNTLGGIDIPRQLMPFPNYNMDAMRVGASAHWFMQKPKGLGIIANAGYTISGRNVGQALSFGGGLTWQFRLFGKGKTEN